MSTPRLVNKDCLAAMREMPDNSVAAVITDPPYGIAVADWDEPVNALVVLKECKRVARDFVAFFGQFPSMLGWLNAATQLKMHPLEHVSWVKRNTVPVHSRRLTRTHEEIFIYGVGRRKTFHSVCGSYEDVRLPGLETGLVSLEAVSRHLSELRYVAKRGNARVQVSGGRQTFLGGEGRLSAGRCGRRITEDGTTNYSNAWSFRLAAFSEGRIGDQPHRHPCEKPVPVYERLIEMCSEPGDIILDPFAGSGTAAVAAIQQKRGCILIEQLAEYCEIARQRIAAARPAEPPKSLEERLAWLYEQAEDEAGQLSLF